MNVVRRLLYSTVIFAVLTGVAVFMFPEFRFVEYTSSILGIGTLTVLVLAGISVEKSGDLTMRDKNILMNSFLIAILVPSFYTAGAFIHQSQTSWSGGEVHWHADYEVIVQGEETDFGFDPSEEYNPQAAKYCKKTGEEYMCQVELIDPENFCTERSSDPLCTISDRTGETEYHEHDDGRIHLEGIFKKREEATLSAFFETFSGELSTTEIKMPTNTGWINKTENEDKTVKIIVKRGAVRDRGWCALSNKVNESQTCRTWEGELAYGPSQYVISHFKKDKPTNNVLLDDIFIIYDDRTVEQALNDLKEDQNYRGFKMFKQGG